jgi:hypothetical protein
VIKRLMIGMVAAALPSMGPTTSSAQSRGDGGDAGVPHILVSTTHSAQSKETAKNKVWGTIKYKTAKRKPETYGSSKGMPAPGVAAAPPRRY